MLKPQTINIHETLPFRLKKHDGMTAARGDVETNGTKA